MPTPCKLTMGLSTGDYRWTETYYFLGAPRLDDCMTSAVTLRAKRAEMLSSFSNVFDLRITVDGTPFDTLRDTSVVTGKIITPEETSHRPYSTIKCRIESSSLRRRTVYLGGLDDSVVTDGNRLVFTPFFTQAMADFTKLLTQGASPQQPVPFAVKARIRWPTKFPGARHKSQVVAGGVLTVVTKEPHTLAPGDRVKISYTYDKRTNTNLDEIYIVNTVPNDNTWACPVALLKPVEYPRLGFSTPVKFDVFTITNLIPLSYDSRPRGSTYRSPHGKKRPKVILGH